MTAEIHAFEFIAAMMVMAWAGYALRKSHEPRRELLQKGPPAMTEQPPSRCEWCNYLLPAHSDLCRRYGLASEAKISAPTVGEDEVERAKLGLSILRNVREQVEEASHDDEGRWVTCSGCHETNDGQETGDYPYSPDFGCVIGGGCMECGGLGMLWDTTDYAAYAEAMMADDAALAITPSPSPARTPCSSGGDGAGAEPLCSGATPSSAAAPFDGGCHESNLND